VSTLGDYDEFPFRLDSDGFVFVLVETVGHTLLEFFLGLSDTPRELRELAAAEEHKQDHDND
jgi:hypothetical protein